MSAQYTPGPWHAMHQFRPSYSDHGYRRVAVVRDLVIYAEAKNMYQEGRGYVWGDVSADANVIAAATELLNAAQAAWNCISELPPTQARVEVAQLLQAAIEKATGAQP